MVRMILDPSSLADYRKFLAIKRLPSYQIRGSVATFPDEYADRIGIRPPRRTRKKAYHAPDWMFDYQAWGAELAIRKQLFCAFWECLSGDTVIHAVSGDITIENACKAGMPLEVFSVANDGSVKHAWASAPWQSGTKDVYRLTLASGRTVDATMKHEFLSAAGWVSVAELSCGDRLLVSDASLLRSTLESFQPSSLEDDRRCLKTLPDCPGNYSSDHRPYGGQPHLCGDTAQVPVPLPADAVSPGLLLLRADAGDSTREHSHRHPCTLQTSTGHSWTQAATTAAAWVCQHQSCGDESSPLKRIVSRLSEIDLPLQMRVYESHQSATRGEGVQYVPCLSPCEWDTLVAVHYIGTKPVYDMHVPEFHNFLANNIWTHNCGLGKTALLLEFARHAADSLPRDKCVLIVSPLMVIQQTLDEAKRFYNGDLKIDQIPAAKLGEWLESGRSRIGITNYEAIRDDLVRGRLGALINDESSNFKSHYGKWGTKCIELGRGLPWKLCLTGTPAPNDRIEYANHAVHMEAFPNVNSFLAKFFVNRGQTSERWVLKPCALRPFYLALSHWSLFLTNPATYGFKDNAANIPPIHVHEHDVPLTDEQESLVYKKTGRLVHNRIGGITNRSVLSQIAKGSYKGKRIATHKPGYIRSLTDSWPGESTLIWCRFNEEQDILAEAFPEAASLEGKTKYEVRAEAIRAFKAGELPIIISKPEILGLGLNLQRATRQVFSACDDSYEDFHQCVKRSNRVGSTRPLNVHIPVTDIERPLMENVLRKAAMVQRDTEEQEAIFKEVGYAT